MRLAHNCFECGTDLSNLRAPPDPHYHLPVVVCPRCSFACVRTRPESVAIWRKARLLHNRAACLNLQLIFAAIFLATNTAAARAITWQYIDEPWVRFTFAACTVVVTGMWLGSCFPHWKRVRLLGIWIALLTCIVLAEAIGTTVAERGVSRGPVSWTAAGRALSEVFHELRTYGKYVMVLSLLTTGVFLFTPLGQALIWVNRALIRTQYRRRKKSFRKLRDDR